jgi:hypothetical protein
MREIAYGLNYEAEYINTQNRYINICARIGLQFMHSYVENIFEAQAIYF